jgi:hypothetical protein
VRFFCFAIVVVVAFSLSPSVRSRLTPPKILIKYFAVQVEDTNYDEDGTAAAVAAETAIPVLETALYFDEPAYKTFLEYFKHDDEHLADMILAYVNAVSIFFLLKHH